MDISVGFPTNLQTPDHIVRAEQLGYSRAWCYDAPAVFADIWMTLARAADRTSRIGLGTWQFGSREWGYGDAYAAGTARQIVRRARELGVTLFDTAEIYGFGKSERMRNIALACMGFGLIFYGLNLMTGGLKPLRNMPEVERIHTTSGRVDLLLQLAAASTSQLDDVLDQIGGLTGVRSSESLIHLSTKLDRSS